MRLRGTRLQAIGQQSGITGDDAFRWTGRARGRLSGTLDITESGLTFLVTLAGERLTTLDGSPIVPL